MRTLHLSLGMALVCGLVGFPAQAQSDLKWLKDAASAARVCDAVRTEASVRFDGDEVERGRARSEFKRRRDQVLTSIYAAEIPGSGFAFGEYDFMDKRLPLETSRQLRLTDGVELMLVTPPDEEFAFVVAPEIAANLAQTRAQGRVGLRVVFRLAATPELPDPCVRLGGGRILKMRVDPLAFDLSNAGLRVARAESPRYADSVAGVIPVVQPRILISRTSDLADPAVVGALERAVLACYRAGLEKNARLRGSVVIGMSLDREGRVEWARPEIDAIGDAKVIGCTVERMKAQRFPRGGHRLSVPVFFQGGD